MPQSLPTQMRYIDMGAGGPPEILTLKEGPLPHPGPHEVLIKVHTAGVNRPDVIQRLGHYPPPPGAPAHPGLEVSGHIVATGSALSESQIGQAVCALVAGGGYGEYVCASLGHCLPVPRGFTLQQAAALPETCFTVWSNIFDRAALQPDETILIHGGSSGIGTTAIQMCKAFGHTVFTTVGSEAKKQACLDLKADVVINYHEEDFTAILKDITKGQGVDVILDMVGGSYMARNLKVLAVEGRLVQIAFLQGSKIEIDFMRLMLKRQTITGATLRARPEPEKTAIAHALKDKVWPLIENGALTPRIHKVFPLAQAADAHRLMESSAHIGKIMLAVE